MMSRVSGGVLLSAIVSATGALAAPEPVAPVAMTSSEFGAYVTGRTVTYAHDGRVYGFEQYLPGNTVIWRQIGGECQEGTWYETEGQICFDYGPDVPLQCWDFTVTDRGLGARPVDDPEGMWLYEVRRVSEPLICPAPYLGV